MDRSLGFFGLRQNGTSPALWTVAVAEAESSESAPKKSKLLLLVIVGVNVILGGGAAAFFYLRGGGGSPPAAAAPRTSGEAVAGEDGHGAAVQAAKSGAPIFEFPSIVVNLNEPEGTRYLKATIAIQLADRSLETVVEQLKPVIKDAFIRDLSELNFRQTMGSKNKGVIKRRLLKRFNESLGSEGGIEVLFTEFVVQ